MPDHPTSSPPRAVIIGAGAVGTHIANSLRRGTPLLVIDRDGHVRAAFHSRGVESIAPPASQADSGPFRRGDIAILATSACVAAPAARTIPDYVPIVCLSNGVVPELATLHSGSIAYGVVEFAVSSPAPGQVARAKAGLLTLQRQSPSEATAWLAAALDPSLQKARLTDDIDAHRHAKLMLNASLDPVAAVIGGSIGDVFSRRESFRAFRALLREALAVARASPWRLCAVQGMRPDILSAIFSTPGIGAFAARATAREAKDIASTLSRELARGEIGEADHLCGAISRQGAAVGVPTPAHTRAMEVLRRIASTPNSRGGRPEFARDLIQR